MTSDSGIATIRRRSANIKRPCCLTCVKRFVEHPTSFCVRKSPWTDCKYCLENDTECEPIPRYWRRTVQRIQSQAEQLQRILSFRKDLYEDKMSKANRNAIAMQLNTAKRRLTSSAKSFESRFHAWQEQNSTHPLKDDPTTIVTRQVNALERIADALEECNLIQKQRTFGVSPYHASDSDNSSSEDEVDHEESDGEKAEMRD